VIFPYEIRVSSNRKQAAKGSQTGKERTQIKKWCKLARGFKAKRRKENGRKTRAGYDSKGRPWDSLSK
jgi:hypothetical protein